MNKNIKYIIETIQKFNPVEYQEDAQDLIDHDTIINILNPINGFIFQIKTYKWKRKNNILYINSENLKYTIFDNIKNSLFKIRNSYNQLYPNKDIETVNIYIRETIDKAMRDTYNLSYETPGNIYELAIISSEMNKNQVQDYKIHNGVIFRLEFGNDCKNFSLYRYYKQTPVYSWGYNENMEEGFSIYGSVPKILLDKIINEFNL